MQADKGRKVDYRASSHEKRAYLIGNKTPIFRENRQNVTEVEL